MTVALKAFSTAGTTASVSTISVSHIPLSSEGDVVTIIFASATAGVNLFLDTDPHLEGVSYGGDTTSINFIRMPGQTHINSSFKYGYVFFTTNQTTGTFDVQVKWTTATTGNGVAIIAASFTGVDMRQPVQETTYSTGVSSTPGITIQASSVGLPVACMWTGSDTTCTLSNSSWTEVAKVENTGDLNQAHIAYGPSTLTSVASTVSWGAGQLQHYGVLSFCLMEGGQSSDGSL